MISLSPLLALANTRALSGSVGHIAWLLSHQYLTLHSVARGMCKIVIFNTFKAPPLAHAQ